MNIGTKLNNAKFGQQMQNDFSRKLKQILKLFTKITHILEFPINLFWSLQKVQIEPLSYWMLVQGSKMSNLVDEYKVIFRETEANLETSRRLSPYNGVSYKFLKSEKSLNRIFWVTEYWYKAFKFQICSTNAKLFFWKSDSDFETF